MFERLIEKYLCYKYKEGDYYRIEDEIAYPDFTPISLLKGPYKGTMYAYGPITCRGDRALYQIEVLDYGGELHTAYNLDKRFIKIVGNVLRVIMINTLKNNDGLKFERENFLDEEVREDYFEESVSRRTVRQKDTSLSER